MTRIRASAADLAAIRVAVFGVLLVHVLVEDLASVARVPAELRVEMGVMRLLHAVPGWAALYESSIALTILKAAACVALTAATLGLKTRWTTPVAALFAILHGGILREQSHLFHSMIAAIYLAVALAFMPCGERLSLDAWIRGEPIEGQSGVHDRSAQVELCWTVLALVYLSAGLSKIANGGLAWASGANIEAIVRANSVNVMHIDLGVSRWLEGLPLGVYTFFGVMTLATELSYPLVLVSRRARVVLPILAIALHLGIVVSQGILFLDLIVLQLAFLGIGHPRWRRRFGAQGVGSVGRSRLVMVALGVVTAGLLAIWVFRLEHYPLTSWQIYSRYVADDPIPIWRMRATTVDGREVAFRPDDEIGALSDCRYRDAFRDAESDGTATRALLRAVMAYHNERSGEGERWEAVRVETWRSERVGQARWSEPVWIGTIGVGRSDSMR